IDLAVRYRHHRLILSNPLGLMRMRNTQTNTHQGEYRRSQLHVFKRQWQHGYIGSMGHTLPASLVTVGTLLALLQLPLMYTKPTLSRITIGHTMSIGIVTKQNASGSGVTRQCK